MIETETKSEKFKRLLEKRYANLNKSLDVLSKIGNKRLFEYTDEQKEALFKKIDEDVKNLKKQFA